MQPVLKKMRTARVKIHTAFLVNQRLQQPHFGFAELDGQCRSAHGLPCLSSGSTSPAIAAPLRSRRSNLTGSQVQQPGHIEQNNQSPPVLSEARHAIEAALI